MWGEPGLERGVPLKVERVVLSVRLKLENWFVELLVLRPRATWSSRRRVRKPRSTTEPGPRSGEPLAADMKNVSLPTVARVVVMRLIFRVSNE